MSWSLHCTVPSPALVQSTSVVQTLQRYLLPSWFAIACQSPLKGNGDRLPGGAYLPFSFMGFPQHLSVPSPRRVTMNSDPQLEQTYLLPASFAIGHS